MKRTHVDSSAPGPLARASVQRRKQVRWAAPSIVAFALAPLATSAQTMTAYGLVDASVRYVDNARGSRSITQGSGDQQGSRLGFRGGEDLGDGYSTVFALEMGLSLDTGTVAQGGVMFGRQSFVGLSSPFGSLTLGRQYDFMVELGTYHAVQSGTGTLDWNHGDLDRVAGERFDNSIKYTLRTRGAQVGLMHSLSETIPGSTAKVSASSALFKYDAGPLSVGVAATRVRDSSVTPLNALGVSSFFGSPTGLSGGSAASFAVDRTSIYGAGAAFAAGKATVMGLWTRTNLEQSGLEERLTTTHGALRVQASTSGVAVLSLTHSSMRSASWTRAAVAYDYFLSRRTDLYASVLTEKAEGANARAVLFTVAPSTTNRQSALVAGIRHRF